jgi:hypothetical protein
MPFPKPTACAAVSSVLITVLKVAIRDRLLRPYTISTSRDCDRANSR